MKPRYYQHALNIALVLLMFSPGLRLSAQTTKQAIESFMAGPFGKDFSGSLMVVDAGQPILIQAYGFADRQKQIQNTTTTLFTSGSITKMFTAVAIMQLEEQGFLSTADPLQKFFPHVPSDKADITLHQLLTHGAGFPGAIGDDYEAISSADFLEKTWDEPLLFTPGTDYEYSNVGFSILGVLIEKLSNQKYGDYMKQHLFQPAGMKCSGYTADCLEEAIGYHKNGKAWGTMRSKKWDGSEPYWHLKANGGILTNADDMARWYTAFMGDHIISSAARQKMLTGYNDEKAGGSYYGYGIVEFARGQHYGHNGGNGIFFADWHLLPAREQAIFICTNVAKSKVNRITEGIIELLAGKEAPKHFVTNSIDLNSFPTDSQDQIAETFLDLIQNGSADQREKFIMDHFSEGCIDRNGREKLANLFGNIKPEFSGRKITAIQKTQDHLELSLGKDQEREKITLIVDFIENQIDKLAIEATVDE